MWLPIIATGLQFGQQIYNTYQKKQSAKKAKERRATFFNNELKPMLDKSTQESDVDFEAIKDVEMGGVINNLQNQLQDINKSSSKSRSKSNFSSNSFIDKNESFALDRANESFEQGEFEVDRTIQSMQQQIDDTIEQNKIRAKQLEYQYKYG